MSGGQQDESHPWHAIDGSAFGSGVNAAAAARSRALFAAADNLLTKAERAVEGDEPRARRFVQRALALDYDEHEGAVPALQTATYRHFSAVADAAGSSPVDDERWLDLVQRQVESTDGLVGVVLVETLAELCDDGDLHDLELDEVRRLRDVLLAARRRVGRGPVDDRPVEETVPPEDRESVVLGLVRLTRAYRVTTELLLERSSDRSM